MRAKPDDLLVSPPESEMQEAERIEDGMRGVPESLDQYLLRDLGSTSPFGVTAHSIDGKQKRSVLGHHCSRFVLVIVPGTEKADVGVVDVQGSTRALLDWTRFISRPAVPSA